MESQVFPIIPAHASVYLILIPILLVVFIGGGVATYAAFASRHVKFEVSRDGKQIALSRGTQTDDVILLRDAP